MSSPIPENEKARLEALHNYRILDTAPEQAYDDIVALAAFICGTPIAIMSLVDRDRQWFKSKVGLAADATPRDQAFCAYTILRPELLEVEDATNDERFQKNPLVLGEPGIRFYAGAPLLNTDGHSLGSVCVIDRKPHKLSADQKIALQRLARLVMKNLELRRISDQLATAVNNVKTLSGLLPICSACKRVRDDDGYWQQVEVYVKDHTDASFTHGMCPKCAEIYFPGLAPRASSGE